MITRVMSSWIFWISDMGHQILDDFGFDFLCAPALTFSCALAKALEPEQPSGPVFRLGHTVGVQHDHVAGPELDVIRVNERRDVTLQTNRQTEIKRVDTFDFPARTDDKDVLMLAG